MFVLREVNERKSGTVSERNTARDKKCDFEYGDFLVPFFRLVHHSPGYWIRSRTDREDRSVQIAVLEEAHLRWNMRLVFRATTTDYL